jgi:PGF-pre-PGF domain-containing protein
MAIWRPTSDCNTPGDFDLYTSGIYTHQYGNYVCGPHEISIVGYSDADQYWISKNSWGTGWGDSGYFRIAYSENVLDFNAWYNDPYDMRSFFLDRSNYVTSTDISTSPTVSNAYANITYANRTIPINFSVYAKGNSIKNLTSVEINGTSMSGPLSTGGTFSTIKTLSDFGCQDFEGNCVLTINATDDADKSNTNEKITVVVDDLAPRVTANPTVYPANQNAARNGSLITLNATIIDIGTGVNATVNASQVNSSLGDVILNNSSGFWRNSSVIVNASDGTYYLNVTAYDNAGNLNNTAQIIVIVDNTRPLVSIYPVSYQRGNATNKGSIIGFNVSASDNLAGIKNASVNASLINNTGIIELTNQSGFWRGNATFDKLIPPDDGNYSLNVTFFDYAGNLNDSAKINITIDNTPPLVTDVIVSSRFINVTGFVNITADIISGDSISEVNESEVFARITYPNGTSINYNMSGGSTFYRNFTDTAQYGRFNVTILANDTTGNTNSTQKTHFVTTLITNISVTTNASNETVISAPFSNTTLRLFTNNTSTGSINITQSKVNITSNELTNNPGIYVLINISASIRTNLSYAVISVNYTDAEISSLVESSLRLHKWNTPNATSPIWDKLSGAGSPWYVNNAGVDTNNNFVWANITNFSEFGVSGDLYVPPAQPYISSGGGGGGGGGGPSGENYTNIEVKENYDLHIFKDQVTSYRYTNRSNPVMFVNITGNISAGEINAAVEVLRNTSTLIKPQTPAPGIVYKNVNIWVGTTGFAVPKNIKIAAIKFKVLNTWLESNSIAASEIKMVRWDGSKWVTLDTIVKEKDSTNTYYEATTDTFSPFAITGLAHAVVVTETPTRQAETATATAVPGIPGFEATIAILVIALLAASLRNDRKRR